MDISLSVYYHIAIFQYCIILKTTGYNILYFFVLSKNKLLTSFYMEVYDGLSSIL